MKGEGIVTGAGNALLGQQRVDREQRLGRRRGGGVKGGVERRNHGIILRLD